MFYDSLCHTQTCMWMYVCVTNKPRYHTAGDLFVYTCTDFLILGSLVSLSVICYEK